MKFEEETKQLKLQMIEMKSENNRLRKEIESLKDNNQAINALSQEIDELNTKQKFLMFKNDVIPNTISKEIATQCDYWEKSPDKTEITGKYRQILRVLMYEESDKLSYGMRTIPSTKK